MKCAELKPRMACGPVKRYGAEGQASMGVRTASPREVRPRHHTKKATLAAEPVEWLFHATNSLYKTVNCLVLEHVVKRLLRRSPSHFDPLYRALLEALKENDFTEVTRFEIVATGIDPKRKAKPCTRLRVKVPELEREFELPYTFLYTCKEAFQ